MRPLAAAVRLRDHGRRAVLSRARTLAMLSRAPAGRLERQRALLHQRLRELRAGARRRLGAEQALAHRARWCSSARPPRRCSTAAGGARGELERLALALAGHDPQRTLERGYALAFSPAGEPLTDAAAARAARELRLRFADGEIDAEVRDR